MNWLVLILFESLKKRIVRYLSIFFFNNASFIPSCFGYALLAYPPVWLNAYLHVISKMTNTYCFFRFILVSICVYVYINTSYINPILPLTSASMQTSDHTKAGIRAIYFWNWLLCTWKLFLYIIDINVYLIKWHVGMHTWHYLITNKCSCLTANDLKLSSVN